MGRKGAHERKRGTPTKALFCRVKPETLDRLREAAERNATTIGRLLDGVAHAASVEQQKKSLSG